MTCIVGIDVGGTPTDLYFSARLEPAERNARRPQGST